MTGVATASPVLEPSRRFGRYVVHECIGRGGMGEVWLASAEGPHGFRKKVVLKIVRQDLSERRDLVDMLIREAAIAARLNHPNIVTVFDLDQVDGTYFFVMEHVPGYTMAEVVRRVQKRGGALAPWFLLGVVSACCDALHYAHELTDERGRALGLVHRDISLGNIMVSSTGNVTILDFGIAVSSATGLETESGMLKGKFQYMPPEIIRGETIDRRCDIYGLGVVMYIALTGRVPYPDLAEYDLLRTIVSRPPPPISAVQGGVPRALERIVETAMAHDPDERYPDAVWLAAAVRDQLRGRGLPTADDLARYVGELFGGDGPIGETGVSSVQLITVPSGPPEPPEPPEPPDSIDVRELRAGDEHELEELSISVDDLIGDEPSDDLAIPEAAEPGVPVARADDAPSAKTTPMRAAATEPPPPRAKSLSEPPVRQWGPVGLLPPIGARDNTDDPFTVGTRRPERTETSSSIFDGWTRSVRRPDTEDPAGDADNPPRWPWSR